MRKVKVTIIGAGSAGLSALRGVKNQTDDFVMIDQSPLGTKCARTGCMPSKALILAADDYHRRRVFTKEGIDGAGSLHANIPAVLRHVRAMRDHFAGAMAETTRHLAKGHLLTGKARILAPDRIRMNKTDIQTECIIIATGSHPVILPPWKKFAEHILTSDTIFEQEDLPARIAVIGLGPIGLEIGQALCRLGIEVTGFDMKPSVGGITDPAVSKAALRIFKNEFPVYLNAAAQIEQQQQHLRIKHPDKETTVDKVMAAVGVKPNIEGLGLDNLGVELDEKGLPPIHPQTMQVADFPVFIAGDANGGRPILHEALDEGFIAGHNGFSEKAGAFCRRVPFYLVFSDPQIATVGQTFQQLKDNRPFVTGGVDFSDQSRATLEQRNEGLLHLYADPDSAHILGVECVCPEAEHLGHLLAMAIQQQLTIFDMLQMPFYHPTITEALQTALQDAAGRLSGKTEPKRLTLCGSSPEPPLR